MLHWLNGAMTQLCIIKHLGGGRCEYLSCHFETTFKSFIFYFSLVTNITIGSNGNTFHTFEAVREKEVMKKLIAVINLV